MENIGIHYSEGSEGMKRCEKELPAGYNSRTLMRDTGPKQTFYVPEDAKC